MNDSSMQSMHNKTPENLRDHLSILCREDPLNIKLCYITMINCELVLSWVMLPICEIIFSISGDRENKEFTFNHRIRVHF